MISDFLLSKINK